MTSWYLYARFSGHITGPQEQAFRSLKGVDFLRVDKTRDMMSVGVVLEAERYEDASAETMAFVHKLCADHGNLSVSHVRFDSGDATNRSQ